MGTCAGRCHLGGDIKTTSIIDWAKPHRKLPDYSRGRNLRQHTPQGGFNPPFGVWLTAAHQIVNVDYIARTCRNC